MVISSLPCAPKKKTVAERLKTRTRSDVRKLGIGTEGGFFGDLDFLGTSVCHISVSRPHYRVSGFRV
jgi:hypothetical protein